jgi:thioredoxin reductase (NADPH)
MASGLNPAVALSLLIKLKMVCSSFVSPVAAGGVVVVGGGNAAVEEAVYLTKFASSVTIVHRRDCLRADRIYQERALNNPKINMIWDSVITEIKGTNSVESVVISNVKTNEVTEFNTNGVFPYVGFMPNSEQYREQLQLDAAGFIVTDQNLQTSCKGVYAAGDIRVTPLRQVITAAADGAIAATSANKYIEELDTDKARVGSALEC